MSDYFVFLYLKKYDACIIIGVCLIFSYNIIQLLKKKKTELKIK